MQRIILVLVMALLLAACGGGEGSSDTVAVIPSVDTPLVNTDSNSTVNTTTSTTDTTTVKLLGTIIDGEISGATVFLDLNRNGTLDSNEPNATSDGNGTYTLVLTTEQKNHKNYLNKKAPIVVYGGVDIRTGKAFEDYLTAIIEDENETNVTPLTTLIAESLGEALDNDVNNTITNIENKMNEIKANLSDLFDIQQALLTKNPIELAKEGDLRLIDTSLQLHKVAKQMKKAMKSEVKDLRKSILKSYRAMAKSLKKLKKSAIKSGDTALVTALDDAFDDNELFDSVFKETIKEESKQLSRDISDYWKRNRVALSDEELTTALNGIEIIVVDNNSSIVQDTEAPIITLVGSSNITIEKGSSYKDLGATAEDNKDGNITSSIVVHNPVDTNTVGSYTVTYNVKDQANNNAEEVTRTVRVEEVVVVERLTIPATDISLRAIEKEALGYKFYLFTDKASANEVGLSTMAFYGKLKGNDSQVVLNSVDARYADGTRFQVIVKDVNDTEVGLSDIFTKSGSSPINFGTIEALEGEFVFDTSGKMTQNEIFTQFNVGFGGSSSFPFRSNIEGEKIWVSGKDLIMDDNIENNGYYANIKDFDLLAFSKLQDNLKKSKFMVLWFTEGWQESWYSKSSIQTAMDAGYIPVFNYWYFGDKLISGMPSTVQQTAYATDNVRVANFLNELNGTKMLIMEPEFNKNVILSTDSNQHQFATLIGSAIDTIKSSTKDTLFSLAMTDAGNRGVNATHESCGYINCALGDQYAWGRPEIIYNDLLEKLDFISFQEMVGQFSRDPSNPGDWDNPNPKSYTNEELGIDFLAERVSNFSKFLHDKYKKPVFLPYIAVTTGTWRDTNNNGTVEDNEVDYDGWNDKANLVYKKLAELKPTLKENGLFGFAAMALFDNPRHDYGGYQYFMNNEYHLGLVGSSAKDEIDIAPYGDLKFKGNLLEYIFNSD